MRVKGEQDQNVLVGAIAACTQINGDLARSQGDLIAARHYYSAAAVGRQILETTQLVQYFSNHPDRAEFWLTASDEDVKRASDLRPGALHRATGSSGAVYSKHCLLGGHPRSVARMLLPGSRWRLAGDVIDLAPEGFDIQTDLRALLLTDALQHLYDTVLLTLDALDEEIIRTIELSGARFADLTSKLVEDLTTWRRNDPLAAVGLNAES